jgi:SAM-dependent methyltransferase
MTQSNHDLAANYGEGCAEFYGEIYGSVSPRVISTLCDLAAGRRVLELGVGTGRVALPLAARGIDVCGVEASDAMISKLRAKPGGRELPVVQGSFADIQIDGSFSLIFALVSTFFLLSSRSEQRQCLLSVARLLSERGIFLIEVLKPIGATGTTREGPDGSRDDVYIAEQVIETTMGRRRYRSEICYAEPLEIDRMAEEAGLCLKQRWRNWQREPYLGDDLMHISLYQRAG